MNAWESMRIALDKSIDFELPIRHDGCVTVVRAKGAWKKKYTGQLAFYQKWERAILLSMRDVAISKISIPTKATVTEPKESNLTGRETKLETSDAGPDLSKWLECRAKIGADKMTHCFVNVRFFLLLSRGCIVALKEMHIKNFYHLDIKTNNICLPARDLTDYAGTSLTVEPIWEDIRLIDFGCSMGLHVKPSFKPTLGDTGDGQTSPMWRRCIAELNEIEREGDGTDAFWHRQDIALRLQSALAKVDWRSDLYQLGYMLNQIWHPDPKAPEYEALNTSTDFPVVNRLFSESEGIVAQLLAWGLEEKWAGNVPNEMPHEGMIEQIDEALKLLRAPRTFTIYSNGADTQPALVDESKLITPVPPIKKADRPIKEPTQATQIKEVTPIIVPTQIKEPTPIKVPTSEAGTKPRKPEVDQQVKSSTTFGSGLQRVSAALFVLSIGAAAWHYLDIGKTLEQKSVSAGEETQPKQASESPLPAQVAQTTPVATRKQERPLTLVLKDCRTSRDACSASITPALMTWTSQTHSQQEKETMNLDLSKLIDQVEQSTKWTNVQKKAFFQNIAGSFDALTPLANQGLKRRIAGIYACQLSPAQPAKTQAIYQQLLSKSPNHKDAALYQDIVSDPLLLCEKF